MDMSFSVGSLVTARNREWVVLPESTDNLLVLRPLGGTDDEITGIYGSLEKIEPATLSPITKDDVGDFRSSLLLRDAIRLGLRSSAGPFRSFARISVEPRPYQLVPLLMALKQDPVRLLIADDVGIGKTIEAGLIARELIDRGEVKRFSVICPPHLAEQWQTELREKFHINAELILASTVSRIERELAIDESPFERFPYTVVSLDYIKSENRRDRFIRTCPELIIVDEAHLCANESSKQVNHQRHSLLKKLSEDPNRHIILVTATPHSGKETAFRSLLGLLDPEFETVTANSEYETNRKLKAKLQEHLVQRRRSDINRFLGEETFFPQREDAEVMYELSPEYRSLFAKAMAYATETIKVDENGIITHAQRVRWWSALALLRSLGSSPKAAAATLRTRSITAETANAKEADELGIRAIFDQSLDLENDIPDVVPGSDPGESAINYEKNMRLLREMANDAEKLCGDNDPKLIKCVPIVKKLLKDGYNPIIFCRFIPTAEYVAEELRYRLGKKIEVVAVTGTLPPAERELRIAALSQAKNRVLVATDCLSEGINLQNSFNAVIHYDLSWNPTRHEQREGRVDRYGQVSPNVRVLTYYGKDNWIDSAVLDVLIKKHKNIKNDLGVSVPVPLESENIMNSIFEAFLIKKQTERGIQGVLDLDVLEPVKKNINIEWDKAVERQRKNSSSRYAQTSISVNEVMNELNAVREAIGSNDVVKNFVTTALESHNGIVISNKGTLKVDLQRCPSSLKDIINLDKYSSKEELDLSFLQPVPENTIYLERTHPIVENLAAYIFRSSMDRYGDGIARRAGVIRTSNVDSKTTLLLLRIRYELKNNKNNSDNTLLAEEPIFVGFRGSTELNNLVWLSNEELDFLLQAQSESNLLVGQAQQFLSKSLIELEKLTVELDNIAANRAKELDLAHNRVRKEAQQKNIKYTVKHHSPIDILGIYVYLPN